ncbi:MAG: hypothetical protein ACYTHJ_00895 [Planctomycetota bacterium]|jgi:L-arabinokinase
MNFEHQSGMSRRELRSSASVPPPANQSGINSQGIQGAKPNHNTATASVSSGPVSPGSTVPPMPATQPANAPGNLAPKGLSSAAITGDAARPGKAKSATSVAPVFELASLPEVQSALTQLDPEADRFVACAPGRLDVMGGSAVYSGSLALSVPLGGFACAVAQRRTDGRIVVKYVQGENCETLEVGIAAVQNSDGARQEVHGALDPHAHAVREVFDAVLTAVSGILSAGLPGDLGEGLSVVIATTIDATGGAGRAGAIGAAVVATAETAMGRAMSDETAIRVFDATLPSWSAVPVSASDVLSGMFGRPGYVAQIRNDPCGLVNSVAMTSDVTLCGIDCGVVNANAADKYWQMRATVEMGRELLSRIIKFDCPEKAQWDRYLSRITVQDFVEQFRDRIPTRIRGSEFIDKIGVENVDSCARGFVPGAHATIDRDGTYKVRSRTEHQIYEHERSLQFAHLMTRLGRVDGTAMLHELGELMYASHWSYGQRCGLGSIKADALVSLLRKHGENRDIFGAKITGNGCGGTVAVLIRESDVAREALHEALDAYHKQTGVEAMVQPASMAGIMETGVIRV